MLNKSQKIRLEGMKAWKVVKVGMKKRIIRIISILFLAGALAGFGLHDKKSDSFTVTWSNEMRIIDEGYRYAYSDRECFAYYIINEAEKHDNFIAEITIGEESGEFSWLHCDDRNMVKNEYKTRKTGYKKSDEALEDRWLFTKLNVDDIYDIDIWKGVKEEWIRSSDEEEELHFYPMADKAGSVWQIRDGSNTLGRCAYVKEDELYLLECLDHTLTSGEGLWPSIHYFLDAMDFADTSDGIYYETLYWRDHKDRVIELENPHRVFYQVPGKEGPVMDSFTSEGIQPCGILERAEYTIRLSEKMPKVHISFCLQNKIDVIDEFDAYFSGAVKEPYSMKVTDEKTGELISEGSVNLSADLFDTIQFTDLDGDGWLDMYVVYPEHKVWEYIDWEDLWTDPDYKYDYPEHWIEKYEREPDYPSFYYIPFSRWIWDPENSEFVNMQKGEVAMRRKKNEKIHGIKEQEDKEEADTITVQPGDNLWSIGEKYYDDGEMYIYVYIINRDVIGENPNIILPGMELKLR